MRIHLCIAILQGVVRGTVSAVALGILIKFIHDYCGGAGHALYGIVVLLLYFWTNIKIRDIQIFSILFLKW